MREEYLLSAARRALEDASADDRGRFLRMIRELCEDPFLGSAIPTLPEPLRGRFLRYRDGGLQIVYDLPDDATVRVWAVGIGPDPRPRR